ncbi:mucin-3B isoform X2 [Ochlerotatus camptorhynchus]|uniref:mucin-3B isoform X2 n=1 Tax=Ochlerotatus camptorhynchus TaxID=644619 RepID=UPI0031D26C86
MSEPERITRTQKVLELKRACQLWLIFMTNVADFQSKMYIWRSVILQACLLITCHIPQYQCSMRIVTPARILAAQTGAAQFQEYVVDKNVGRSEPSKRLQKRLITDNADDDIENYQGVVGRPGIDFPVLTGIPNTKFNCQQYGNGYFADLDTKCQVFHICDVGKKISFLCPNGTIFRQLDLICDWWFKVDCSAAPNHYAESSEMLNQAQRARIQSKHPIHQPIKSAEQFSLNTKRKHALLNGPLEPNLEALALNRRMDTSLEESDESIDLEDISLKRNNIRRSNTVSKVEKDSSEETQTADETASFLRGGKTLNGYSYPTPEKKFAATNSKSDSYNYDKPVKNIIKNNMNVMPSDRSAKVLENNGDKQFGSKNSFNFDAKLFITQPSIATTPVTSTTTKRQILRTTTISSVSRGSTTHQTSTLNQKSDSKLLTPFNSSNVLTQPSLNSFVYTTARKPSTNAKDKPFYTPTIPTVTNKATSETLQAIPTSATVSGAAKHAMEMMKTLQELEISETMLVNRPGVEVPPSSGPNALHSLALYFANDLSLNATTTISPVEIRLSTENVTIEEKRPPVSATLLSQRTIDRYQQLFNIKTPSTTTESLEFETRFSDDSSNDLEGQYSRHPVFGVSGSPQIRELAQVFTHALSAYLQDPNTFRRILSEIRPKAPHQLIVSNHIDQIENAKNEDISTEETSYFLPFNQITPAPRAALIDDLEVLDFSDVTLPTTVKRETTIGNAETTTEISWTTIINPLKEIAKSNDDVKKTPASNLITEELEKTAAVYREKQVKGIQTSDDIPKNELADEVNEELGTLKPSAFRTVESLEDFDENIGNSSYVAPHQEFYSAPTITPYGTKTAPHHRREELTTSNSGSAHTVYFDLLPPQHGKFISPHKGARNVFLPADQDEILEDDEQLQRAQSQSIISSRNSFEGKNKRKTMYSLLKTDKALQQSGKVIADIPITTTMPTSVKGHYITKQLKGTGKITPNAKTTLSYTVFLDPLTINDGLMDLEKDAVQDKTITNNAHTYLPSSQIKTTTSYVASTTPATSRWYSTVPSKASRRGKSNSQLSADESNENELMETMQKKANQMFGDLDESEADHLMNVMKTADTNKSVRRLILLLIQTCDDDYNKTVEDSRKALLSALISMDRQEGDSSEIHVVKSKFSRTEKGLNKSTTTVSTPVTLYRSTQFERLTGTTTYLDLKNRSESNTSETTTTSYDELKSTNLDLLTESSTTLYSDTHLTDDIESNTIAINLFPEQYATTNIPTTTIDYDTTTNVFTTTELPTTAISSTIINMSRPSFEPTIENKNAYLRAAENSSNLAQKSLGNAGGYVAVSVRNNSNQHSDTRALELLRSLYSLASRWG